MGGVRVWARLLGCDGEVPAWRPAWPPCELPLVRDCAW
jgi:hypothetical protein